MTNSKPFPAHNGDFGWDRKFPIFERVFGNTVTELYDIEQNGIPISVINVKVSVLYACDLYLTHTMVGIQSAAFS